MPIEKHKPYLITGLNQRHNLPHMPLKTKPRRKEKKERKKRKFH